MLTPRARRSGSGPRCAARSRRACNQAIVALLLEHGAVPADHDLYLAGFAGDDHECLRLLPDACANVGEIAAQALAASISQDDAEGVRLGVV